jgi:hypothetical protein
MGFQPLYPRREDKSEAKIGTDGTDGTKARGGTERHKVEPNEAKVEPTPPGALWADGTDGNGNGLESD